MLKIKATSLVFCIGLIFVFGGCVSSTEPKLVNEEYSVYDAKAIAQQVERELAELVPVEYVMEVRQDDVGVLLSCGLIETTLGQDISG